MGECSVWLSDRAVTVVAGSDGESGKRFGNEAIRVTDTGEVSIELPAPLAYLANSKHGRYVLAARVAFAHRGAEWRDRITGNRAVAYSIHCDPQRGRCDRIVEAARGHDHAAGCRPVGWLYRRRHQRRPPDRLAARPPRQPSLPAAPLLLRPVRHRRASARAHPARSHPPAPLGEARRRQGGRDRAQETGILERAQGPATKVIDCTAATALSLRVPIIRLWASQPAARTISVRRRVRSVAHGSPEGFARPPPAGMWR